MHCSCLLALLVLLPPAVTVGQTQAPTGMATLQGSVRDTREQPVAGATVYLQVKDGSQSRSTLTDAAGHYRFSALRDGIYMLRVEMKGYSPVTFGPCVVGPSEAKTLDLTVESPKEVPRIASSESRVEGTPEFFDEPQFTVAGVTDGTNLGGHGSNTIVRTKDALAKDIASLSVSPEKGPQGGVPATGSLQVDG